VNKPIPVIPSEISVVLKKDPKATKLCGQHYQKLRREIKALEERKEKREEEKEREEKERGEENVEKDDTSTENKSGESRQEDSEKSITINEKKREESESREKEKAKHLKYGSEEKFKIAATALRGCSLSATGEVIGINEASMEELERGEVSSVSRSTVVQALGELYQCVRLDLARKVSSSSFLAVALDTSTDKGREMMGIHFAGISGPSEEAWASTAGIIEVNGHKAQTQVAILKRVFEDLNEAQSSLNLGLTALYEIRSLTSDNTGSNTGDNGVRGILEEERQISWERSGMPGKCPPLIFKGCEDHIVHLASKELERRLVNRALSWGMEHLTKGDRHASSVALCHIAARLRADLFCRPFKAFCRRLGAEPPSFPRYSETRYTSIDILCLKYAQSERLVLEFLRMCRSLLSQEDLSSLKVNLL